LGKGEAGQTTDGKASVNSHYDYIVVGAGGAGLSVVMRILDEPALAHKTILLIDRSPKTSNDRTWCFWEKDTGYFEHILHHQWNSLFVKHTLGSIELKTNGYAYKMLRGIDFYKHCFARIKDAGSRVHIVYGEVTAIEPNDGTITVDGNSFASEFIFSSVLPKPPELTAKQFYLLQHFRGWWIETDTDRFDPSNADLMNFRVPQTHGCAFVYVMPVNSRRALVEYTLFTENELTSEQYDEGLRQFISNELKINAYKVSDIENGVIPMTNYHFKEREGKVIYIGTAGGQTKASTGYTFSNMQKHALRIAKGLAQNDPRLLINPTPNKFRFYDSTLLRVLQEQRIDGADVFYRLFKKNPADRIFRFLDNESSLFDELAIMLSAPKRVFTLAALRELS
jgi:lycopene beta-cyclase